MTSTPYRADIDGLRAIAVLSVVLYHFGLGGLRGGFVGVDVFFVISGYLITGIVQAEIAAGRFTLARFYERRARRIFPALFAMLGVVLAAGWFLLLPSDLARLGQATLATVLFASNLLFATQGGYFDESADFNLLLHTWSLGVEEQFYLGLPLLLLVVARWRPRALVPVLAAATVLSLAACVAGQWVKPKAVFFLSPFRAWELLAGALLAVRAVPAIRNRGARELAAALALAMLLATVAWMRADAEFPGWRATIPVLATAVLLHIGGTGRSRVHALLGWRPLVWVGLVSYSLYLWHWPLLVLARYRDGMEPPGTGVALVLLGASLLLAALSHRWIETPFRRREPSGSAAPRRVFLASGLAAAILAMAGGGLLAAGGAPSRVGPEVAALDALRTPEIPYRRCDGVLPDLANRACTIGAADAGTVALVWGDSHALAWAPGLDGLFRSRGIRGVLAVNSECAPLMGVHNPRKLNCHFHNNEVMAWIRRNRIQSVFLIAAWPSYSNADYAYELRDEAGQTGNHEVFPQALQRTIEQVTARIPRVVLVGPTPFAPDQLPFKLAYAASMKTPEPAPIGRDVYTSATRNFWATIGPLKAAHPEIIVVDPSPWFCDRAGACAYQYSGNPLFRDGHHLNVAGARFAAAHLRMAEASAGAGRAQ